MKQNIRNKENAKILYSVLNIIIYIVLFLIVFYFCYSNASYMLNTFIIISCIYTVFIIVFGNMFETFELGEVRVTDLFLSYSLSLFVSNFIIYFIICLMAFRRL